MTLGFPMVGFRRHMDNQVWSSREGSELKRGILELVHMCVCV